MSKGIVRLICINDEKVMSVLLSDNIINFYYEYADNVPSYDVEFRISFSQGYVPSKQKDTLLFEC